MIFLKKIHTRNLIGRQKPIRFLISNSISYLILMVLAVGCANIIQPTGGPRDTTPPQVIWEKSTPNESTNFDQKNITLTFNEWVKLEDVNKQVVISPPFQKNPKIRLKKRTVVVDLSEEELRPNATYTINFGEAVKDLTENNPAENLRFVFATGDYIDSLTFAGEVKDAITGKEVEKVLVMLYDVADDSVVYKERPFYFATTDKSGIFKINNIKDGVYKAVALQDGNLNYLLEENEQVAFLDTMVAIDDSVNIAQFLLAENEKPLRYQRVLKDKYGKVSFVFNKMLYDSLDFRVSPSTDFQLEYQKDTLHFYYNDTTTSRTFYLNYNEAEDTVKVVSPSRLSFENSGSRLGLYSPNLKAKFIAQKPDQPIELTFSQPVSNIDADKIFLLEDTLLTPVTFKASISEDNNRIIQVKYGFKDGRPYKLIVAPQAITSYLGGTNGDSLKLNLSVIARKELGIINIKVDSLDKTQSYVVELMNSSGLALKSYPVSNKNSFKTKLVGMDPGKYTLRIIVDINKNGRWDSALYPIRQPEPIFNNTSLADLRANWELDLEMVLSK